MGLGKLIHKLGPSLSVPSANPAVSATPTPKEILQNRQQFGVNFGGCFVREKWLFHSTFPEGTDSEAKATAEAAKHDRAKTKADLEHHWKSYASGSDWDWLRDNNVNAVRVPIGYWTIAGGQYTQGTVFEKHADIYANAWSIFKSHFVEPAAKRGIAILVDVHGVPGGANGEAHSGEGTGKALFWTLKKLQKAMLDAYEFIARDLAHYDNICGLQVVNEAEWSDSGLAQQSFYADALAAIRRADPLIPVVVSDGWNPQAFAKWAQKHPGAGLVVDHHVYRCFSDADKRKLAEQVVHDLNGDVLTNLPDNGAGVDFIVGEWLCVLAGESLQKNGANPSDDNDHVRRGLRQQYGAEQARLFRQRAAGLYFWTYKFESGNGGEWDLRQQLGQAFLFPQISKASINGKDALHKAYDEHVAYWDHQNSKQKYEHNLYKEGFESAWADADAFALAGAAIGRRQAVKHARVSAYETKHGRLEFMWEYSQGYDKALLVYYGH